MALTSAALCAVADFNADTGNADTSIAERFIHAASAMVEKFLNRGELWHQEKTEKVAGWGTQRLLLERSPLVSFAHVKIEGVAVTDYSVDDAAAGILYREAGWPSSAPLAGEAIADTELPGQNELAIEAKYTAGWWTPGQTGTPPAGAVTLPADLSLGACMLAAHLFLNRGKNQLLSSQSAGNASQSYQTGAITAPAGLPPAIAAILNPYRRMT